MFIGVVIFKKNRIADSPSSRVGTHNEFIGNYGVIITSLCDNKEGEVELLEPILGTRSWPAVCINGAMEAGSEIKIVELRGNTLVVEKK